jgi:hypothetical protein
VEDSGIKRRLVEGDGSACTLHPQLRLNASKDVSSLSARDSCSESMIDRRRPLCPRTPRECHTPAPRAR